VAFWEFIPLVQARQVLPVLQQRFRDEEKTASGFAGPTINKVVSADGEETRTKC
jgi:hypothetical protein